MNVKLIASAAGIGVAGLAVGVFALVGGSGAKQAPKVQSPVAQIVSTPAPSTSASSSAPVKVAVKPAVKRQSVVSSSVQVQSAPAPVRRVAAVTEPTAATTPADPPAQPVSDPATQGPNGGPLPTMLPPVMHTPPPVAYPTITASLPPSSEPPAAG